MFPVNHTIPIGIYFYPDWGQCQPYYPNWEILFILIGANCQPYYPIWEILFILIGANCQPYYPNWEILFIPIETLFTQNMIPFTLDDNDKNHISLFYVQHHVNLHGTYTYTSVSINMPETLTNHHTFCLQQSLIYTFFLHL